MAHLSNSDLQAFLKQELKGERLLEIDDHLSECADCREALENGPEAARTLRYMESTFAGPHLDFEEFQMLMEGGQVPAEVMRHAAACQSCAAELAELTCYAEGVAEIPRVSRPKLQIVPSRFAAPVRPWSIQPGWYGLAAAVLLIVSTSLVVRHRMLPAKDDVASLRDGGSELSIDRSGELHGDESVGGAYRDQLRSAMATGRLQTAPLNFSAQQKETLLSAPGSGTASPKEASFELLSPVGRVVVDDPPTFRWQAVTGARSYRVTVYGANYAKIVESPGVQGTEWQATAALPTGGVYTWTVTAETASGAVREPAPPKPEAVFRTMDADVAAALREAEVHHADDSLLLAVLYARAGAVVEARAAIDKLAAQNPNSPLVAQLRASLPQDPSPIKSKAAQ